MIDLVTIIIGCSLLVLAIVSAMTNPLFRIPTKHRTEADSSESAEVLPPVTIIVSVNDNVDTLRRNLPLLLNQKYASGFQIVLVANEGDSAADDLIKLYKEDERIQSTFIPRTARYISKEKLGITLGVKAACNEWCILLDALSYPESDSWLSEMAKNFSEEKNLVLGYCNYAHDAKAFQRFARLRHFANLAFESQLSRPYAANFSNLAFRKSEFIKNDGYRGNLECIRGEYDFIINKYARKDSVAISWSEKSFLTEVAPSRKQWHRRRIFYIHSCRLMKHGFVHHLFTVLDSLLLHSLWICSIATIAYASFAQRWILLGMAILALLISIIWRTFNGLRMSRRFHAGIAGWMIVPLEMISVWHATADYLRYQRASKYDFTSHKL